MERTVDDAYQPLTQRALPRVSPALAAAVDAGLAIRASDRPQTIGDFRALMRHGPPPGGAAVTVQLRPPPAAPRRTQRWLLWSGAGAGVLLAMAGGAYLAMRAHTPGRPVTAQTSPPPRSARAFDAAKVPFVSTATREELRFYAAAPGAKSLALNFRGYFGFSDRKPNDEVARREALANCETVIRRRVASPRSEDECQTYAVGDEVVPSFVPPPMPLPPYVPATPGLPAVAFDPALILFINDTSRRAAIDYATAAGPKAIAIGRRSRLWTYWGTPTVADATRRTLEACGHLSGRQCLVLAVNDSFAVRLPETHRIVEALTPADQASADPESHRQIERYLVANDWRALARGRNGRIGVATDQPSEAQAIAAATAECARAGGTHCTIVAIGPFVVSVATSEELQRLKAEQSEARRRAETRARTTPFDGAWTLVQTCPRTERRPAFSARHEIEITRGAIFGQTRSADSAGDTLGFTGHLEPDGKVSIDARGIAGSRSGAPGSPIAFGIRGRLEASHGTGAGTEGNNCVFAFTRR